MKFKSEIEDLDPATPWLQRWFPELARFPDEEKRNYAWRKAGRRVHWSWGWGLSLLVVCVISYWVESVSPKVPWFARHDWILPLGAGLVAAPLLAPFVLLCVFRARIERCLRRELLKYHVLTCLRCGYDLRGQTQPRCPECGERI